MSRIIVKTTRRHTTVSKTAIQEAITRAFATDDTTVSETRQERSRSGQGAFSGYKSRGRAMGAGKAGR